MNKFNSLLVNVVTLISETKHPPSNNVLSVREFSNGAVL